MAETVHSISHVNRTNSQQGRYYKLQASVWTDFDPTTAELTDIARAIEQGHGVLSVIEVTRVVDDASGIDDPEIRQRFETVRAAEKLLANLGELPQTLREKLYAALGREQVDDRIAG